MKTTMIAAVAVLATSTSAFAQDGAVYEDGVDVLSPTVIEDSFDDNSDRTFNDSFDDNSDNNSFNDNSDKVFNDSFDDNRDYNDSFDNNSDNFDADVRFSGDRVFGDSALVAETQLSNVVTGVDVDFGDVEDEARFVNRLSNSDNAFQNYAGMNAMNQNTGVGASQNASVTVAVSTDNFDVN